MDGMRDKAFRPRMASFSSIFHLSRLRGKWEGLIVERVPGGKGRRGGGVVKGIAELECHWRKHKDSRDRLVQCFLIEMSESASQYQ